MIISASRRTDIPALYSRWLRNRLEAEFCTVPNPFNPRQVARVSLAPVDVDAIVFWTRHAAPILPLLPWLHGRGYRFYIQYTITGYGSPVELRTPPLEVALRTFRRLAEQLPAGAVIWRYDPILVGPAFPAEQHRQRFAEIAARLEGAAQRVVVSAVHIYRKTAQRLGKLYRLDEALASDPQSDPSLEPLLASLATIAHDHGMEIEACAQEQDYSGLGIGKTKCVDDRLLSSLFGGTWSSRKDPGQRPTCACIPSKDIGMGDTCTFGCAYCYATRSDAMARKRRAAHDANSPSLFGWHEPSDSAAGPVIA